VTARSAGLWVLLAIVWFGTLGIRPLYKADESRYAEI
jgi:4-amino-4-deoxy-L-arabinose transferase-like glycosyltransferase